MLMGEEICASIQEHKSLQQVVISVSIFKVVVISATVSAALLYIVGVTMCNILMSFFTSNTKV